MKNDLPGERDSLRKARGRNKGQRPETRRKYRDAIEACDSEEYIDLNVSQIARMFDLDGTALANQLRAHYPEILPRREAERRRRGIADNIHRGVRRFAEEEYAEAVAMLRDTDMTMEEAADRCGVSYPGLRQHIIFYHKEIARQRELRRIRGQENPKTGTLSGNGRLREMPGDAKRKYAKGVELYRTTSLPVTEIARRIGVNVNTFRHHLRTWHRSLMFDRRNAETPVGETDRPTMLGTKRYDRAVREKYAEAIESLKTTTDATVESISRKFGFIPEVFRAYLKEHEPELFESLGMMTLPNGKTVLRRSYEKYKDAIEAYQSSKESLKSIAERFGIPYKSLSGFIRRNL